MRSVSDVFKTLPLAKKVFRADALPDDALAFASDDVVLDWEQRTKTRARRVTSQGLAFATALPRGTVLRAGDCFVFGTMKAVVHVIECAEQVLVIRPGSAAQAAEYAYHIGNSHSPMMVDGDVIVCPELPGMTRLLQFHGIPFERDERPFTPMSPGVGHQHTVRS